MDLPGSVLDILKDFTSRIRGYSEITRIILYGSYARNRWRDDSDIDIAVFIKDNHSDSIKDIYKKLYILCCDYPLDVQIQVFPESELLKPMGIVEEVVSYGIDVITLI